ncbi:hypothetical protein [Geomicrobium sediminis]|uniref:Uncharacterized protein n=1 Tax=Geomicrobium sediminis TaxID=1347788 RepID=A0ABS2PEZ6_9BACL|nr:hypothetical protein [Geomicrobium sediminis]MBM7633857.1 hypothetical protein [Geomicrobium sediminis]
MSKEQKLKEVLERRRQWGKTRDSDFVWLTQNLNKATVFEDKEKAIEEFKYHEKMILEMFGEGAVCNFGYTNIMKHFEFVEVEISR